jgi:hypothetical protein
MKRLIVLAVLVLLAPAAAFAADATGLTGHWVGGYECAQGKMGLVLDLVGQPDGTVTGTFAFAPTKGSGPMAATGSYALKGSVSNSGLFSLNPDSWITRPAGYEMVGMLGFLGFDGLDRVGGFSGEMKSAGCGKYRVERTK